MTYKLNFLSLQYTAISGPVLDLTKQHKLFLKLIAPMVFVTDIAFIFMGRKITMIVYTDLTWFTKQLLT